MKTKELKIKMTPEGEKNFKDLQKRSDCPEPIDLIRRSIALYDMMVTLKAKGYTFMATAEGELPKEIEIL
jgi:hypothetical protein